jgi:hypothetical protein
MAMKKKQIDINHKGINHGTSLWSKAKDDPQELTPGLGTSLYSAVQKGGRSESIPTILGRHL